MAQLSINFITDTVRAENQDPYYRVQIGTGLVGTTPTYIDGDLLLIERKNTGDGFLDVFYGIVKAVDFAAFRKASPSTGQTMYRVHNWNLVFYNKTTMDEAIALMQQQVDILSEDLTILQNTNNRRSVTHLSPSF